MTRSFSRNAGPGDSTVMKAVFGSGKVCGQVSRTFAVPVMVSSWPCWIVWPEKVVFQNATVLRRSQGSWECSPCAKAAGALNSASRSPSGTAKRSRRLMVAPSPFCCSSCRLGSNLLGELSDRPDREHPPDELPDPVARDRHRRPERERHVQGLAEEGPQRALLDQPQVLRGLGAQVFDALHVGEGEGVAHEAHRLEEGRQHDVVGGPEDQRPAGRAYDLRYHPTLGFQ